MKELISSFYKTYSNYRGSGKILVLFLVSLLVMHFFSKNNQDKENQETSDTTLYPLSFVLFIPGGICYAFSYVYDEIRELSKNNTRRKAFIVSILAIGLSVIAIFISGMRVFTKDNYIPAENTLHVSTEYIAVFDRMLEDMEEEPVTETAIVAAPPSISPYISAYTSKMKGLYNSPVNANPESLDTDARIVYEQFLLSVPNSYDIAKASQRSGCEYILLDTSRFYPEFKPDAYDYEYVDTVGNWEIYRYAGKEGKK